MFNNLLFLELEMAMADRFINTGSTYTKALLFAMDNNCLKNIFFANWIYYKYIFYYFTELEIGS